MSRVNKILTLIIIIISVNIFGCTKTSDVKLDIDSFREYVENEDYVFAEDLYLKNKDNKEFITTADEIINKEALYIAENITSDNILAGEDYLNFLTKINKVSSGKKIKDKLDEIEKTQIENKKEEEEKEEAEKEDDTKVEVPKLEITNNYGDFNYKTYTNSRFGFSIEYPSFLDNEKGSQNNDGKVFSTLDNRVVLTISGYNNVLNESAATNYENIIKEKANVTYKTLGNKSYVVSWEENEIVHYYNQVVGEGSVNTFHIKYPKKDIEMFNEIVTRLYNSFKTPAIDKAW